VVVLGLALVALPLVGSRARRARLGLLALVPPVLLLPWVPEVVARPGLLLLESGLPGPGLSERELPALDLLLLRPGGPGLPPAFLTAALLLAAFAALLRHDRRGPVLAGWLLAVAGLAAGVVLARVEVSTPALEAAVPAWPGPALVLAGGGLVLAAVVGAEGAGDRLAGRDFGWRQPAAVLVALGSALTPAALAGWWVLDGAGDPLRRDDPVLLPAFVAAEGAEPSRPRTLVLRPRDDGRISYAVLRSDGPRTGDAEVVAADDGGAPLGRVVADLASGRGGDAAARLVPYGVRFVLLARPVDRRVARAVEAVPGIVQVSGPAGSILWRVDYPTARLRLLPGDAPVVSADGAPPPGAQLPARSVGADTRIPDGPPDRLLVLAEPRDGGWRARLDGQPLPARGYDGWAQAFAVPRDGGRLEVTHEDRLRGWLVGLQMAALVLAVLLSLPSLRTAEDVLEEEES
jgi:hypothetical protein